MKELLQYLLVAANVSKKLHWETKSFAMHLALDELNSTLHDFTDRLAEEYFGAYGTIADIQVNDAQVVQSSPLDFISDLVLKLEQFKSVLGNAPLQNTFEELQSAVFKVKYKLENLR